MISNEGIDISNESGFNEDLLESKKKKMKEIIIHEGVKELNVNCSYGTQIASLENDYYSSDLFSNLNYEDVKKAYTETIIPVTKEDFNNIPKYNNINEYKSYRSQQNLVPLSEQQANEYFNNRAKMENSETTFRAFKLASQGEEIRKRQQDFWGNILKISNK